MEADGTSPFELQALGMGSYRWGSYLPRFLPVSPAEAGDLYRHLVAMKAGAADWRTGIEFRAWVALCHELVHYLQDVTTGVGHWDHMVRKDVAGSMFGHARGFMEIGQGPPFPRHLDGGLREASLMVTGEAAPAERIAALRENTAAITTGNATEFLLIEHVLEAEAAAVTCAAVLTVATGAEPWAIAADNMSLWMPGQIDAVYDELFSVADGVLRHVHGDDFLGAIDWLRYESRMLGAFADLACAHPSPALVEARGTDVRQYEPGVRMARLLAAFGALDGDAIGGVAQAIVDGDLAEAERGLLTAVSFPYIGIDEIYADWHEQLQLLPDDSVRDLRLRAVARRLEDSSAWMTKNVAALIFGGLPAFVLGVNGPSALAQNEDLDRERQAVMLGDFLREASEQQMGDYFFATARYRCPWAFSGLCDGAVRECRTGWERMSDLPHADCGIRDFLEENDFEMNEVLSRWSFRN